MFKKAIHLLYAPTIFCNMSCQYCYLGKLTDTKINPDLILKTLHLGLQKMLAKGYLPFNLSFHGGEISTLPVPVLDELFNIAANHYAMYQQEIKDQGFKLNPLHIKTNLLNFHKLYDLFDKHHVSISASVDLPLTLHAKFRRDKKNKSTLNQIIDNLKLLSQYPHHKKMSCVITEAHFNDIDQLINDINYLHHDIHFDMRHFNIMFGFDTARANDKFGQIPGLKMLTDTQQAQFYQRIKVAFKGSVLEDAFKNEWFKEFTPEFCCSAMNCGQKFFLLQENGDVYSCPRGQASPNYHYGNIYHDDIETIIDNGWKVIERNENTLDLHEDCLTCEHMHYCHAGCTYVREQGQQKKSYTCALQKAIYADNPERYPPLPPSAIKKHRQHWLLNNNIKRLTVNYPQKAQRITNELYQDNNQLTELIAKDPILTELYSKALFFLEIDGLRYHLQSPLLKTEREIESLDKNSKIILGVKQDLFDIASEYPVNNHILLMMLRDSPVTYGDEQRNKQEHNFDYAIYQQSFMEQAIKANDYFLYDISALLNWHALSYIQDKINNLFITTRSLRDYHYVKQRKNAFYHIQAINLPFQNFEFYWQGKTHGSSFKNASLKS